MKTKGRIRLYIQALIVSLTAALITHYWLAPYFVAAAHYLTHTRH